MLGFDRDSLLSVDTLKSVQQDMSRAGTQMGDLNSDLLQRLSGMGADMEQELAALLRSNEDLYQQAMFALQQTLGNQGVTDLHQKVQEMAGQQAEQVGQARDEFAQALEIGREGASIDLPFRSEMESAFGTDFSNVTAHVSEAANQVMGSEAFQQGTDIIFGDSAPDIGLVAHELAHVVQQRGQELLEGTVPELTEASSAIEAQAEQMADAVRSGGRAPQIDPGQLDAAAVSRSTEAAGSETADPPEEITLNLGGISLRLEMPGGDSQTNVHIDIGEEPITGLTLEDCSLDFDEDWEVISGTVNGGLALGDYISKSEVSLTVERGGSVEASIEDCELTVSNIISSTINVTIGSEGCSASGTIGVSDITLPLGLTLTEGELNATADSEGNFSARGQLTGEVTGLGSFTFQASVSNEDLTGSVEIEAASNNLLDNVTLNSGTITGDYSEEGIELTGSADVTVRDFNQTELTVSHKHPDALWGGDGRMDGAPNIEIGGIAIEGAYLDLTVVDNALTNAQMGGIFTTEKIRGQIDVEYDVQSNSISGSAAASLLEEIEFGEGSRLVALGGRATFENNVLTEVTGSARATFPYQGQETFDVHVTDGEFDVQSLTINQATATVTTTRDLTFGNEAGTHVVIPTGAQATASLENNGLTEIGTGFSFIVNEAGGELGRGNITGNFDPNSDATSVSGDFTLSADYGVPDRAAGPFILKSGGTISATVDNGVLQTASVEGLGYEFSNPLGEGKVVGSVSGTVDFENHTATVTGDGRFDPAWAVETEVGRFALNGGSFTANIADNELTSAEGNIDFETQINAGEQVLDIAGSIAGSYERGGEGGGTINGSFDASLQSPLTIPMGSDRVEILANAGASGSITDNSIDEIRLGCEVTYYRGDEAFVRGSVTEGTYVLESGELSFEASLELASPITTDVGDSGYSITVTSGTLDCTVVANALTQVGGSMSIDLNDSEGALFTGSLTEATYAVEEGEFSGTLAASTARVLEQDVGNYNIAVHEGSGVTGTIAANNFTEVTADFTADVSGEGLIAEANIQGTYQVPEQNFVSAQGTVTLLEDYELVSTGATTGTGLTAWTLAMTQGSGVGIQLANNAFQDAGINVGLTLTHEGEQMAEGNLAGTYNLDNVDQGFTGSASASLTARIPLHEGARFAIEMGEATTFDAQVTNSRLTQASGTFELIGKEGGEDVVSASISGTYNEGQGLSGEATVTVLSDILVAERGDFALTLCQDSGGSATIADNDLTNIHGTVNLRLDHEGEPFATGDFEVNYDVTEGSSADISATGTVELLGELEMGTVGEYTFTLTGGTGVSLTITNSELESLSGTVNIRIDDTEGEWIGIEITADYQHGAEPSVSGNGSAEVLATREMGTIGEFAFSLDAGSGAEISLENNAIIGLGGTLNVGVKRGGEPFAAVILEGTWSEADSFSGTGQAQLLGEIDLGEIAGGYSITVEPSTEAHCELENGTLVSVGGTLVLRIDDSGEPFIRAEASGDMTWEDKLFTGTGSCSVLAAKELGTLNGLTLFLNEGSGMTAAIEDNNLQEIGGNVSMRVDDAEGPFMTATLQDGRFDMAGGTGFSGTGGITITREKELANVGGYSFRLAEGAGATATIVENALTEVGGNVPFKIFTADAAEPLIVGHCEGTYTAETESFTGSGDIRLGRTVEFDLGGGTRIDFLAGSGGNATVTDNELTQLGGTLMADLYMDGEQFLHIEGDGEYNAVTNELTRLSGEASLVREWSLFGGNVVVQNIEGHATIEMGQLVEAGGEATVNLPNVGEGVTGTFDINWENRGAGDVFWGSGTIEFAINDKISGEVDGELQRDGGFSVSGEVTYEMNEMITGTIGVSMDQEFDPILSGTLTVEGVELIPGRDLFSMDMRLFQFGTTVMAGPVPVAISGGAGLGMKVGIDPLIFGCEVSISDFHPLDANIPTFEARADMSTGLTAEAALKPYFQVGIGASGLSAGAKIKGALTVTANASLNPYAIVRGDGEKFGGELGLGLNLSASASLGMALALYAELGTESWDYDLWEHEIPLGELFSYDWNTKYTWGDDGPGTEEGASPTVATADGAPTQDTEAVAENEGEATTGFGSPQGPTTSGPDRPEMESHEEMAQKTPAGNESEAEGAMGDFESKMEDARRYGSLIQGIAEGFGVLMNALSIGAMIPPPFGVAAAGLYLVYKHISGEYTFQQAADTLTQTWALVQEVGPDIVSALIPEWATNLYNFVQENGLDGAIRSLATWLEEKLAESLGDYWPIIQPLCDFFTERLETMADMISRFTDGNITLEEVLETVWDVMGLAVGSPIDLVRAVGSMMGRIGSLIRKLIQDGKIWVRRVEEHWGPVPDDYEYGIEIPGLCNLNGDNWAVAQALDHILGVPMQT